MTTSKHTKKALLASVLSMLLCASMLVGSTFAWFTDSVTSGKNTIVAGNLDIELEYSKDAENWDKVEEATGLFDDVKLWEPGAASVVYMRITNKGNLALKYKLGMNAVDTVIGKNADDGDIKLSEILEFGVVDGQVTKFADRVDAIDAIAAPQKLNAGYTDEDVMTVKDETKNFALVVYMPEETGNEANYRGEAIPQVDLGVGLVATQTPHESDSFGPDYDEGAAYPLTDQEAVEQGMVAKIGTGYYKTLSEAVEKASNGQTIRLLNDVSGGVVIPEGKEIALDLGGHTLSADGTTPAVTNNGTITSLKNGRILAKAEEDYLTGDSGAIVNSETGIIGLLDVDVQAFQGNAIYNQGKITEIAGGTYYGHPDTYHGETGYYPDDFVGLLNSGTIDLISGGTYQGSAYALSNKYGTIGQITGGLFDCPYIDENGISHVTSDVGLQYLYFTFDTSSIGSVTGGTWYCLESSGGDSIRSAIPAGHTYKEAGECAMTSHKIRVNVPPLEGSSYWGQNENGPVYYYYTVVSE